MAARSSEERWVRPGLDHEHPLAVRRDTRPGSTSCRWHRHDCWELVYVTAGSSLHHDGRQQRLVLAGDVFAIPPGEQHMYPWSEDFAIANILISDALVATQREQLAQLPHIAELFPSAASHSPGVVLHLPATERSAVRGLIAELEREDAARRPFCGLALASQLQVLLLRLLRATAPRMAPPVERGLSRVLGRMEADCAGAWKLTDLARDAGMSERSFLRLFRTSTGSSPIDYLLRLRLRRAAELLCAEPQRPVTDIAFATGFNDSNYFARQFRRVFGTSPRSYRLSDGSAGGM